MITRTVRAENMLTALEVIKKELGSDALVISARQIMSGPSWQVWRKPLVEVVAVRLVEGEPPEQLKNAISQHQAVKAQDLTSGSGLSLDSPIEEFQPKGIDDLIKIQPQPQPPTVLEKKHSAYLKNYKPKSITDIEAESQETPESAERKVPQIPKIPKITPEKTDILPAVKDHPGSNRKKEILTPIFEHISTENSAKKSKETIEDDYNSPVMDLNSQTQGPMPTDLTGVLDLPPMVLKTYQYLLHHGLDEILLQKVAQSCADTLPPRALLDKKRVWDSIQKQLESVIKIQPEIINSMPRVIFLIGTSGVGKTSTLAKLAAHLMINEGRKVGWVCADTVRIGALGEARTYSETIGIPLQVVYTPDEIQNAINLFSNEVEFTLVDTPSYNPRNEQSIVELGEKLTAYPQRCTWVVLPATAKENDLQNTLATISPFKPKGLIISKLDETNNFSSTFNIAWRCQLPLTYFSFGSRIINDLIPAKANLFVKSIFDERFVA